MALNYSIPKGAPLDKTFTVLLVEDEPDMSRLVARTLKECGFAVKQARNGIEARRVWESGKADVVILDILLPDVNGLELLTELREKHDGTPVIVTSALGSIADRVTGLDLGADDYLAKPFSLEELIARIRARVRRDKAPGQPIHCGDLVLDPASRRAYRAGKQLFLSSTEYALLELLALQMGKPVSKQEIMARLWDDVARPTNILEVYVCYLRAKTERRGATRLIHTAKGQGYVLEDRG